ncbi:hypothetical protein MNBD_GAMMA25-186 [hydrothermal vent metagenome]|uniref:Uncharacterized protein n=1 Tax=hydrothermal vent metagenome TaxID=652676 RepID=A0A3B1BUF4_9ZZZZ
MGSVISFSNNWLRIKKRAGCIASRPFFCARYFYKLILLSLLSVPLFYSPFLWATEQASAAKISVVTSSEDEVSNLINIGVWHLALTQLEQQQLNISEDTERWLIQEKQRIHIYQATHNWAALISRLQNLPDIVPLEFYIQARTELANALIKKNKARAALTVLQNLIWTQAHDPAVADVYLLNWRRMIIDAYRVSGQKQDAYRAAARLQHDYGNQELSDLVRYARILLELGRAEEAMDALVARRQEAEVAQLYLLAQLRSAARSPQEVMQTGLRQLRNNSLDGHLRDELWMLVAEAAQGCGDLATYTNALEHVLSVEKNKQAEKSLYNFNADMLWQAYLDFAVSIGNQSQFLIGDDVQWQQAAEMAVKKQPVRARSLTVLLMFKAQDQASRDLAVKKFVESMSQREQGKPLMTRLFLSSTRFTEYEDIPETARHMLADIALAKPDIELASALMATVKKPPAGADQFFWYLRRARILILGGKGEQGAQALNEMLQETPQFEAQQIDRLMQVIFDLQAADLHAQAYSLLTKVIELTEQVKLKREIYYWMAESKKAQQQYSEAAALYLKSAMYPDANDMGPWAQTARYQAAVVLAQADLLDDARAIYLHLLRVTKDATRKAVLQGELQKLRFK